MMSFLTDGTTEYSARIRRISRCLVGALWALVALHGSAPWLAAQAPVATFFVLPDGQPGPGSESMMTGSGPGGGPLGLDFVEGQEANEEGYVTVEQDLQAPSLYHVRDLRLTAFDRATGLRIALSLAPSGGGTWTTTNSTGAFPPGATLTAVLPVTLSATGPTATSWPTQGTLTLTGTLVPGYYHKVVLLQGSLDVLPQAQVALFMKQDLHPPGVTWVMVATAQSNVVDPAAGPLALRGALSLQRDAVDFRDFSFGPVDLTAAGGPVFGSGGPGSLHLDPATRGVSGVLELLIDGVPHVRVLDGVGESFSGPVSRPSGLHIEESGLGGLGLLTLDLRRVELVPAGAAPQFGQPYFMTLRGPPGDLYFLGAALDPVIGISTPVGDVYLDIDPLLAFSLDPQNGVFFGLSGVMPAAGEVAPFIQVPPLPQLAGTTFFMAGLVIGTQIPGVRAVTNSHRVIL